MFLFHQLGSFAGVWLGGYIYDLAGNYDIVWVLSILLGVVAAVLHWLISERPLERPTLSEVRA